VQDIPSPTAARIFLGQDVRHATSAIIRLHRTEDLDHQHAMLGQQIFWGLCALQHRARRQTGITFVMIDMATPRASEGRPTTMLSGEDIQCDESISATVIVHKGEKRVDRFGDG